MWGEPIAIIVADTAAIAEDALDWIDADIDALPPITDRAARRVGGRPSVRRTWVECRDSMARGAGRR